MSVPSGQPASAVLAVKLCFAVVPGICCLAAGVVMLFYDLEWKAPEHIAKAAVSDNIVTDMYREEATEHKRFVRDLLYPGWRQIYGL